MSTAVVLQPSYIPWRGYFDLVRQADVFVFYDDVQFDKHGWRNRNKIKTASGLQWLTIPVLSAGAVADHIPIADIKIDARTDWRRKHLTAIRHAYARAPFFEETWEFLQKVYELDTDNLCDFTIASTVSIATKLGFRPTFIRSSQLDVSGSKSQRLIETLQAIRATHYISGPSAQAYIDRGAFEAAGISLSYIEYDYEPYPQLHGTFEPHVSIVDLLMMKGQDAASFIGRQTA